MKAIPVRSFSASSRGFSMMELLVVIGIMAILAAIAIPAMRGNNSALQITSASQQLADELRLAGQMARTRNIPVEVRLYELPDPTSQSSGKIWRGHQSFYVNDTSYEPATKATMLPAGIEMSTKSSGISTLISDQNKLTPTATNSYKLPGVGTSYQYVAFQFRPDGSVSFDTLSTSTASIWCVTIQGLRDKDGSTPGLKLNFSTIQIDPVIGTVRVSRPQ